MSVASDYSISDISAASPDMTEQAFRELMEDIRKHGQLVPIWKSNGEIVDGRKRLSACKALGIKPVIIDASPEQNVEALSYSLNILRTHYTASQRAMFAARRATLTRGDIATQRDKTGPQSTETVSKTTEGKFTLREHAPKSLMQAAVESGVSRSAVVDAKEIRRTAAPEVIAAVEAGKLTLYSAQQIVRATPKAEQAAVVDTASKTGTRKVRLSRRNVALRRTKIPDSRTLGSLKGICDAFIALDFSDLSAPLRKEIVRALTEAIQKLNRLRKQLQG